MTQSHPTETVKTSEKTAGYVVFSASILMVAFMAIHPSIHSHELKEVVEQINAVSFRNVVVHGSLMAITALLASGIIGLCRHLGWRRPLVQTAFVAFAIGTLALIAAAAINGLILTSLTNAYSNVDMPRLENLRGLLVFCHEANLACDHIGVVAWSLAVALWSVVFLRLGHSLLAVYGLLIATLSLLALFVGRLPMTVHGFGAFVLAQAIWYSAAAIHLIRAR